MLLKQLIGNKPAHQSNQVQAWYQNQIAQGNISYDAAQEQVVTAFDGFINYLTLNPIRRWLNHADQYRHGYYIYGAVGRGKSMLLDALYSSLPLKNKLRAHFFEFMQKIQQDLAKEKDMEQPLDFIAKQMRKQYQIIFLDEMHVSDIANAMILNNLFTCLLHHGIYLVITSNFAPDDLYPDGLMRERFLPAIALIKTKLNIINLNGNQDYRLRHNNNNHLFILNSINNPHTTKQLEQIFNNVNQNNLVSLNAVITINYRQINYIRRGNNIIWFDFNIICGAMRSQIDYLQLAQLFEWIIIANIPQLTPDDKDVARRFTWLIDILYDTRCKIAISTATNLEHIYPSGDFSNEFKRTLSRLNEMCTQEYLTTVKLIKLPDSYNN